MVGVCHRSSKGVIVTDDKGGDDIYDKLMELLTLNKNNSKIRSYVRLVISNASQYDVKDGCIDITKQFILDSLNLNNHLNYYQCYHNDPGIIYLITNQDLDEKLIERYQIKH